MTPKLKLVETENSTRGLMESDKVVQFPQREASTFEAAWACRAGMMKKRGDGSDKTKKLWERHSKKVGSARLLEALKAYLREKEPTCGFCGLSVWLNGEKYDHWMPDQIGSTSDPTHQRPRAPESVREIVSGLLSPEWVVSYLDPCTFHEDGYVTPRTSYAKEKLMEQRHALKAAGIAGIRSKE